MADHRLRSLLRTADPARVAHEAARSMAPDATRGVCVCLACGAPRTFREEDSGDYPEGCPLLRGATLSPLEPCECDEPEAVVVHPEPIMARLRRWYYGSDRPGPVDPTPLDPERVASLVNRWQDYPGSEPDGADVFDVAQGLYWYCAGYHAGQGSGEYRILCSLGYSPGASERGPEGLAREVYAMLAGEEWRDAGAEFAAAYTAGVEGLEHVSHGTLPLSRCPQCPQPLDNYCESCGASPGGHVCDCPEGPMAPCEGHFSWSQCDACHSALGGDRHAAHGVNADGDMVHLDVCLDCVAYMANGELPEEWRAS